MSTGARIPFAIAARVVEHLQGLPGVWNLSPVGSFRRKRPDCGDLEFIAPVPDCDTDPLYDTLSAHFADPPPVQTSLFAGPPARPQMRRIGAVVQGLSPRFRHARLTLNLTHPAVMPLAVEVYRYDDGPCGNRGWIELIRTGPREFGMLVLSKWKDKSHGGRSLEGYPTTTDGQRVPVPDEAAAFALVGMAQVAPADRDDYARRNAPRLSPAWRGS